jgi:hypothetical protein
MPMEMISPLVLFAALPVGRDAKKPVIGMFADLEIKLINGPIMADKEYLMEKEIFGLGESRRTESMWVRKNVRDGETKKIVATSLLNSASLQAS